MYEKMRGYRVATISRLLRIIGLFCRISSFLWNSFAKETYNFKEPTNRSHPTCVYLCVSLGCRVLGVYDFTNLYVLVYR